MWKEFKENKRFPRLVCVCEGPVEPSDTSKRSHFSAQTHKTDIDNNNNNNGNNTGSQDDGHGESEQSHRQWRE